MKRSPNVTLSLNLGIHPDLHACNPSTFCKAHSRLQNLYPGSMVWFLQPRFGAAASAGSYEGELRTSTNVKAAEGVLDSFKDNFQAAKQATLELIHSLHSLHIPICTHDNMYYDSQPFKKEPIVASSLSSLGDVCVYSNKLPKQTLECRA